MINKVFLIGNLGKDPEVKTFDNGSTVAKFPVATNENYRDKAGEWQTVTEWHNIVVWGPAAERASRDFKKGSMIYIEGKLTTRKWQDDQGKDNYITEVRAVVTRKLDRREEGASGINMPSASDEFPPISAPKSEQSYNAPATKAPVVEDDLPF